MKNKRVLKDIIIGVLAIMTVMLVSFGVTGAWYSDKKSASATITVGKAVSITVDGSNVSTSTPVLPGERVNINEITFNIPTNTSNCFIRIKAESSSTNYILDNQTTYTGENTYNWINYGGYYYLVNSSVATLSAIPEGTQLKSMSAGTSVKFNISNILVNSSLTQSNAGVTGKIKVTAEAIQSANYATTNWADCF